MRTIHHTPAKVAELLASKDEINDELARRGKAILRRIDARTDVDRVLVWPFHQLAAVGWYEGQSTQYRSTELTEYEGQKCVVIHCQNPFRGCTDYGSLTIPIEVYDSGPEGVFQWVLGVEQAHAEAKRLRDDRQQEQDRLAREAHDRQEFERLQRKFGGET